MKNSIRVLTCIFTILLTISSVYSTTSKDVGIHSNQNPYNFDSFPTSLGNRMKSLPDRFSQLFKGITDGLGSQGLIMLVAVVYLLGIFASRQRFHFLKFEFHTEAISTVLTYGITAFLLSQTHSRLKEIETSPSQDFVPLPLKRLVIENNYYFSASACGVRDDAECRQNLCTQSPRCASLNRYECTATDYGPVFPHSCGWCKPGYSTMYGPGPGRSQCILVGSSSGCAALNREDRRYKKGMCGNCLTGFIGNYEPSNVACTSGTSSDDERPKPSKKWDSFTIVTAANPRGLVPDFEGKILSKVFDYEWATTATAFRATAYPYWSAFPEEGSFVSLKISATLYSNISTKVEVFGQGRSIIALPNENSVVTTVFYFTVPRDDKFCEPENTLRIVVTNKERKLEYKVWMIQRNGTSCYDPDAIRSAYG
eukprot:c17757_g1_i1.p1 GENE.c17757_g1_i1~~c17757_g1_i1.p1  ORF type:complete len:433 (-),score=81.48 c17757_g1_i1:28-1302(-)